MLSRHSRPFQHPAVEVAITPPPHQRQRDARTLSKPTIINHSLQEVREVFLAAGGAHDVSPVRQLVLTVRIGALE